MKVKHIFVIIKKKHLVFTALIMLFVFILIGGFYVYRSYVYKSREQAVMKQWILALPKNRIIKYCARAVYPDGHRTYIAYTFKEEPTKYLTWFSRAKQPLVQSAADEIITAVKNGGWLAPRNRIPKKYLPDWDKSYYSKIYAEHFSPGHFGEGYCMVYFPELLLFLVCETYLR